MTLFSDPANTPAKGSSDDQTNQGGSYLERLVGDGKKYKDTEALARSRIEVESFAETLKAEAREKEAEIARLHKELNARISLEEAVSKITAPSSNNAQTSNQPSANDDESNAFGGNVKGGLTAEQAEKLFEKKLLIAQQELVHQSNLAHVAQELDKVWGADRDVRLRVKSRELGLSEDQVDGIAKNNPKALLAMFGVGAAETRTTGTQQVTPPRSSVPMGQSKITPGVKNKAYWDAMKQSDSALYFSQSMTIERHRSAVELGDGYFN